MRLPFLLILLSTLPAAAAELQVSVTGIRSTEGEVGCALHTNGPAFPMAQGTVAQLWLPAAPGNLQCRFTNIAAGSYAVAVSHDLNGNRRTDTNLLGIPTEDWGVSNNVRPTLRAPRFDEAAVEVTDGPPRSIEVRLGR